MRKNALVLISLHFVRIWRASTRFQWIGCKTCFLPSVAYPTNCFVVEFSLSSLIYTLDRIEFDRRDSINTLLIVVHAQYINLFFPYFYSNRIRLHLNIWKFQLSTLKIMINILLKNGSCSGLGRFSILWRLRFFFFVSVCKNPAWNCLKILFWIM